MSRDLIFRDANGAEFQPVKHFNRKTGVSAYRVKPLGASNETDDCIELASIEEVARAMLVDGLPARVKAMSGGPVNYLKFGAQKLVAYELSPEIAERLGVPRTAGGEVSQANKIRKFAKEKFIDPARSRNEQFVEIVSGDVHREMKLSNALPAVCSALESEAFSRLATVKLVQRHSPIGSEKPSSTIRYKFLLNEGDPMDEQLLARFDGNVDFRSKRRSWSSEQAQAFCKMARAVHAYGLDWYDTNIPEIRFGRRNKSAAKAVATLGQLLLTRNSLNFSHSSADLALSGSFNLDANGAGAFEVALANAQPRLAASVPFAANRDGYWPNDYTTVVEAELRDDAPANINPTNLILYGPPGTGKTYGTMEEAVRYCGEVPAADRPTLRMQYERLQRERRIGFVTFHQNFAYEEFVEGLRPHTGESGTGFELKPKLGIFRNICQLAEAATDAAAGGKPFDLDGKRVFKMSLGRAGIEDQIFYDAIENGYAALGWGGDIDWSGFETYEAIRERWNEDFPGTNGNDANIIQTTRFRADMREGDVIIVSHGNKLVRAIGVVAGPYEYEPDGASEYSHRRKVDWLKVFQEPIDHSVIYDVPFMQWSCYLLKEQHLNRLALANLLPGSGGPAETPKQYVLVIDEINRANISKVFGELITLIEPDKRLGMKEQLRVRLPYSEEEFGVPANLHIIGTMNTSDRSIALLDTALRRRFRFKELAPRPSLLGEVEGVDLQRVLRTINQRIEYLIDREHRIGHAYFMDCNSREAIDRTMRDNVIPLLQEYFFEDWSRIRTVLGPGFIGSTKLKAPPGFPGDDKETWHVQNTFGRSAYDLLISGAIDDATDGGDDTSAGDTEQP